MLAPSGAVAGSKHSKVTGPRHCKKGYRRIVKLHGKRRKARCVKRKTPTAAVPAPRTLVLHAHIGPFTQNPLNPYEVAYDFSASATSQVAGDPASAEPAPLPEGVLALYSDGSLECAINVVGAISGSRCSVTYKALGPKKVTVILSSGAASASVTEIVTIQPIPTTTTLSVTYEDVPPHEIKPIVDVPNWLIGELVVEGSSQPFGQPSLGCDEGAKPGCIEAGQQLVGGTTHVPVYAEVENFPEGGVGSPTFHEGIQNAKQPISWFPASDWEGGMHNFHARSDPPSGYLPSEETATIQFTPQSLPGWYSVRNLSLPAPTGVFQLVATIATYVKKGATTPLHVRTEIEAGAGREGCLLQTRVNGDAAPGDLGKEGGGTGVGLGQELEFTGIGAGPVVIEVWTRYAGEGEPPASCGLNDANYIASE